MSSKDELLKKSNISTIRIRNIRTLAIEMYKSLNNMSPEYICSLFETKNIVYKLRDESCLNQPLVRTTTYGLRSIRYFGPKLWNMLPKSIKDSKDMESFKQAVSQWLGPVCNCSLCMHMKWHMIVCGNTYFVSWNVHCSHSSHSPRLYVFTCLYMPF